MQFRLRTLLILLVAGPPVLAGTWWLWPRIDRLPQIGIGPWEAITLSMVVFILCGHHLPRLMRALFRDPYF